MAAHTAVVLPIHNEPDRRGNGRRGEGAIHLPRVAAGSCWWRSAEVAIDAKEVLQDLNGDGRDLDGSP